MIVKNRYWILLLMLPSFNMPAADNTLVQDKPYHIRRATMDDKKQIKQLWFRCRSACYTADEAEQNHNIDQYISETLQDGIDHGIALVLENKTIEQHDKILAYTIKKRSVQKMYNHILQAASSSSDPDYRKEGLGWKMIQYLLQDVQDHYPDILRVETYSNESGVKIYEQLGFHQEGRLEKAYKDLDGKLYAEILMVWMNPNFNQNQKE